MKKSSKPKYATKDRVDEREEWRGTQPLCWLCMFFGRENQFPIEVHEIVNRSTATQPYERHNFAALCGHRDHHCHHRLQSRGYFGRVACLALKSMYDGECLDLTASVKMMGYGTVAEVMGDVDLVKRIFTILSEKQKL